MTLWLILTILTAGAALIVAAPFLFRNAKAGDTASSIDVYKDQLAEVERDKAQGLIEEAEAASARVEIERRILSAGKAENEPAERIAPNWQYHMVTGVAAIVVLGSVGLYASLGRPELAGVSPQAQQAAVAATAEPQGQVTQAADGQQAGGDVNAMVKRLEQRLEANPKDADSWRVLGWSYDNTGRYKEAVTAYGHLPGPSGRRICAPVSWKPRRKPTSTSARSSPRRNPHQRLGRKRLPLPPIRVLRVRPPIRVLPVRAPLISKMPSR
jgi:cytochrome c-type biogenesis protein CcmH